MDAVDVMLAYAIGIADKRRNLISERQHHRNRRPKSL